MKNITILFLISQFLNISCSKELSRGKAEDIIKEYFQYPNVEAATLKTRQTSSFEEWEKLFEENGLISTRNDPEYGFSYFIDINNSYSEYVILNNVNISKNRRYPCYTYTIWLFEREFESISGIKTNGDGKKATVEFTIKKKNLSPFAVALRNNENDIVKYSVDLELYDDGWRIVSEKNNINLTRKDFPIGSGEKKSETLKKSEEKSVEDNKLPFIGTRYFNFYGGTGTQESLTIKANRDIIIKSHSAIIDGKIDEKIIYKGTFTNPIVLFEGDENEMKYHIHDNYIFNLNKNGEKKYNCNGDGPCYDLLTE